MAYSIKRQPETVSSLTDADKVRIFDATLGAEGQATLSTLASYMSVAADSKAVTTGITAFATGGQANATQLSDGADDVSVISTCATYGDSVKLPTGVIGAQHIVMNRGVNACSIFPAVGEQIDALGTNAAMTILGTERAVFVCVSAGLWRSTAGTANGSIGATAITTTGFLNAGSYLQIGTLAYFGATKGITADTNQDQTNATALTTTHSVVSTCATAGDAVKLIAAFRGATQTVVNDGAEDLAIFPAASDAIDDLGANNAYYLHPGSTQTFVAKDAVTWNRLNKGLRYVELAAAVNIDESTMSTRNGTANDLDISSHIPASAYGKLVEVEVKCSAATYTEFRITSKASVGRVRTASTGSVAAYSAGTVAVNASGLVQYATSAAVGTQDVFLTGYWVEG